MATSSKAKSKAIVGVGDAFAQLDTTGFTPQQIAAVQGVQKEFTPVSKIKPTINNDGSVSSTDVTTGAASGEAANSAGAALNPMMEGIQGEIKDYVKASNDRLKASQSALKGVYDANLAAQNQQYDTMFNALEGQRVNASQAANALAAQLNPFSDPRISSATGGYLQAIDQKYAAQAANLRGQMNAAQAQLQAGYYENYTKLVNQAQEGQEKFTMDMKNFGLQMYNSIKQSEQFEKTYALSKETKATDDFRSYLSTLSGSPELQADIATYNKTGKISEGLMPIVKKGMEAGMSAAEAISIFKYQTDSVRKQEALEDYRTQQLVISQNRAAAAADRQTNAQLSIATTQGVLAAQADMRARGIVPGTAAWASGVAAATGSSPKGLTAGQIGKYTQYGVVANQLNDLKGIINSINKDDPIWNTLNTYAGRDAASIAGSPGVAELTARLNLIAPVIGRSLGGQTGAMSDKDTAQVLSGLPSGGGTEALRNALYGNVLSLLRDSAVTTLESDAQAGYQVATYAQSVEKIAAEAEASKTKSSDASAPFNYDQWLRDNGLK